MLAVVLGAAAMFTLFAFGFSWVLMFVSNVEVAVAVAVSTYQCSHTGHVRPPSGAAQGGRFMPD